MLPRIRRANICGVYPAHAGCASSFVIAAYGKIRLIPQALRDLHLNIVERPQTNLGSSGSIRRMHALLESTMH